MGSVMFELIVAQSTTLGDELVIHERDLGESVRY